MKQGYFDFNNLSEEEESLDFGKMRPCPHCRKPIPLEAINCLYCGRFAGSGLSRPKWLVLAVILVLVIFLALMLF